MLNIMRGDIAVMSEGTTCVVIGAGPAWMRPAETAAS
jgi:hypothetical protein